MTPYLLALAASVLAGLVVWQRISAAVGDRCLDGRPDREILETGVRRNPYPQLRDLAGIGSAILLLIVLAVVVGSVIPAEIPTLDPPPPSHLDRLEQPAPTA